MKATKKALALLLALAMLLTFSVTAFAADNGSITVTNTIAGEEYKLYKIFDIDNYSGTGTTAKASYTYTDKGNNDLFLAALKTDTSPLQAELLPGETDVYLITVKTGKDNSAVLAFIQNNVSNLGTALSTKTAEAKTGETAGTGKAGQDVVFDGLAYGYYYVTSSLGSLVIINSTTPSVSIQEKNTLPTQDKTQKAAETGTYADTALAVSVGDTIYYQVAVTIPASADKAITITDTMTAGLTYNNDAAIAGLTASTDYTVAAPAQGDNFTFKVTLTETYVKGRTTDTTVNITYTAAVNQAAAGTQQSNTSVMGYSGQTTTETVVADTYQFRLKKVDEAGTALPGAEFELYRGTVAEANKVSFTDDGNGTYTVAAAGDNTTITVNNTAASVILTGLDDATYILRETKAPAGYNKLQDDVTIYTSQDTTDNVTKLTVSTTDIAEDNTANTAKIENKAGTLLPSTGGMGTTLFYILGGALVVAAGVLLVTKRRMENDK